MKGRVMTTPVWAVVWACLATAPQAQGQTSPEYVAAELKWRVEQLRATGWLAVNGELVTSHDVTLAVYEERGFAPLWRDLAALDSLRAAIAAVRGDGLDPQDYHVSALDSELDGPSLMAEVDLLATDAFVQVAHDLRFGKVQPQGPSGGDSPWPFDGDNPVEELVAVVSSRRIGQALSDLRPHHFVYEGLTEVLAQLRAIQAAGGRRPIPQGPVMRRDSSDARVPALRDRLVQEGDLRVSAAMSGLRFDGVLEDAVKVFQRRHGLNEDGRVGSSTLEALNVPVERRIDQVRVNLERARWITHVLPDTVVVVNAAGARAYLLRGDSVVFDGRTIVGKEYTKTPLFTATMRYVDLNPTWTVPPGIVDEVLANIRADPEYMARVQMKVLDRSGRPVDPGVVDFSRSVATFPYVLRQDPGPTNPLGRIKFMFPNPHNVYLHDTPGTALFREERRLFSHGCIRVENPLALAELLLGDSKQWNTETLRAAIATGTQKTIRLSHPTPVFVLYWTAAVDVRGRPVFYDDVYRRDGAVLAGLTGRRAPGTSGGARR